MANWNNPVLTSTYVNFVTEVKGRDEDLARQFDPAHTAPTNVPTNAIRWSQATNRWEKWSGTAWNALSSGYAISITGNAATATVWQTGRTLTIGNTGKSVNGGANVSWTLAEIGAVGLTGNETVAGVKTFSSPPVLNFAPASDTFASWGAGFSIADTAFPYGATSAIASFAFNSNRGFQLAVNSSAENTPMGFRRIHSNLTNGLGTWNEFVDNVSTQTIGGTKTFSSSPVIPDGTQANHPITLGQAAALGGGGLKNRIINGAMLVNQRGITSTTILSSATFLTDRWRAFRFGGSATATGGGDALAPVGFNASTRITIGTGAAPAAGDYTTLGTVIEGFNTADLDWGTANAKTVTLSFWVRSSVTGARGVGIRNAAINRSRVESFTINAANTWEKKTITIPGDTTGTWLRDNGVGLSIEFDLGVGTTFSTTAGSWQAGNFFGLTGGVKLASTSSATFFVTGVQLEAGNASSDFEIRPYGAELALCQRYYLQFDGGLLQGGGMGNANGQGFPVFTMFPVVMRAAPTVTLPTALKTSNCTLSFSATPHGLLHATTYTAATLGAFSWNYAAGQAICSSEL